MEDKRAVDIIKLAEIENTKAVNFRSLYQQTADLIYPCENQITIKTIPGRDKSLEIRDPTGIFALDDMVAGLIGTWIPSGQKYFGLKAKDRRRNTDNAMRYLSLATDIAHDEMFESNYMLQLHDTDPNGWPAVWAAHVDGSGLVRLADGIFLAKFDG